METCNALEVILSVFLFGFILVGLSLIALVYKIVKRGGKKAHNFVFLQEQIGARACRSSSKLQSPPKYLQLVQRQELLGTRVLPPAPMLGGGRDCLLKC